MIYYQLECSKCKAIFHEGTENCIDECCIVLKKWDEQCETGNDMLCTDCMNEYQRKLKEEDERTYGERHL